MFAAKNELLTRPSGYNISRSLRFRSSASAYLSRTFGTPTDQKKFTYSFWAKLGSFGTNNAILLGACTNTSNNDSYIIISSNILTIGSYQGAGTDYGIKTAAVLRDYSAWYHCVIIFDSANTTSADRAIIYINGVRQTVTNASNGMFPLNHTSLLNSATTHNIARRPTGNDNLYDGYLAEVNFIDGQALTPSSFGAYDTNGIWQPTAYSGSGYGTNGFYLPFSNTTSTTTLVADSSGNSNNWTPNNISVTSGTTYDSMIDSPTNYADGGNGRGNYAVLNPNDKEGYTVSDGNLRYSANSTSDYEVRATMSMSSGKWYWEVVATQVDVSPNNQRCQIGIMLANTTFPSYFGAASSTYSYYSQTGNKYNNAVSSAYGATYGTGDIIGVAFDATNGTLTYYKNGTSQGVAFTGIPAGDWCAGAGIVISGTTIDFNFGQRPFAYTPPSGYSALNTQNLPTPTIAAGNKYFDATIYTGDGGNGRVISGLGFDPDFVWSKNRSAGSTNNIINDRVRGSKIDLYTNLTNAEASGSATVTFTTGGNSYTIDSSINLSANTYVGWLWKANGSGSSNTSGSITSTVSANTSAGFSVVTYTGTGTTGTVGHGLGVAPSMIILKLRSATDNWLVYHSGLSAPATSALLLNTTGAVQTGTPNWNSTNPTSSVFSVYNPGSGNYTNLLNGTYVAYCFAPVAGYSAFGSYTGNGSADGPMIFTGFRPRFVMIKRTDAAGYDWAIFDSARNTYNLNVITLSPNTSDAERTTGYYDDFLSNGFKVRDAGAGHNASGGTYIYAAFAEVPFKYSRAR